MYTKYIGRTFLTALLVLTTALVVLAQPKITKRSFGKTPAGVNVDIYTLRNAKGMEARITNYGGIVVSLTAPDRKGTMTDIVLGFNDLESYLTKNNPYFGAIIGRYGNRIGKGRFTLNGTEYKLAVNNGENHLHGGIKGFDKVIWTAKELDSKDGPALTLTYLSKDGEEGYPGNLSVTVTYTLTNLNELRIDYSATTDKDTVINLTHHSYFNLVGEGNGNILNHQVTINADQFVPTDAGAIPTGELKAVEGTPFDFREATPIVDRIDANDEQIKFGKGYDHTWVINGRAGALRHAASAYESASGRKLEVWTTEPGMQFYTGNYLDGTIPGKAGGIYRRRSGFCFETQHYPDSPNKPSFPTTTLKKGVPFISTTIYKFKAEPL